MNPTTQDLIRIHPLSALAPEIALVLFAVAVLIASAFLPETTGRRLVPMLAIAGTLMSAVGCIALWNRDLKFGPTFAADNFSLFFKAIFLAGLFVTTLISGRFLDARSGDRHTVAGEYYALLMLSTIGMMMVASARDLLIVFLGIETLSIALYVLAGFARARLMSNEAALKYFLLGAFATGFLLYGIALTYAATGSTQLEQIRQNLTRIPLSGNFVLLGGVALILIGLGFKAALVPFHQWTPDVYEGSPTPVTGFMAVGAKAAAFAAILRVFSDAFSPAVEIWYGVMLMISVLTMTVGNVVALSQTSLKRMLAYSSIAHAGYILMGVLAAGRLANNAAAARNAVASVLIYMAVYALMNLGAFATLAYLENARHQDGVADDEDGNLSIVNLRGLLYRSPGAFVALAIFLFSLAGIPPLAGFFAKFYVFSSVIQAGATGLAIVGALNSVISVYYYLRPVVEMSARDDVPATVTAGGAVGVRPVALSPAIGLAIVLCAVGVLALAGVLTLVSQGASSAAESLLTTTSTTLR